MILKDKKIIVTGGSDGIGLEISKNIIKNGGEVIICSRNLDKLNNAKNILDKLNNKETIIYQMDVSKYSDIFNLFNWLQKKSINVNGLVNCAGIYGPIGKTIDIDMNRFIETLNINLFGAINMSTFFVDRQKNNTIRKIINISGGGASGPFPNYSAYSTSKIALVRFTENLSLELKDNNIEVNCIAPGFCKTNMHNETLDAKLDAGEFYKKTLNNLKNASIGEEAAELTTFLLSDKSNGINGKFLSAIWDNWKNDDFQKLLKEDKDFAVLRRIDNKNFYKK